MADISEAIKRLTYQFTSDGADKVAADMSKVNEAGAKLSTGSVGVNEANLSLDKSFGSLERRYVSTIRQQQDYAKVQDQVKAAVQQNPALMERGNAILAEAALKYGQAGVTARAFAAATSGVSGQLIALSAGAGPVGVFLSALGPWGVAAAAGLALVGMAFEEVKRTAAVLGAESVSLERFAETTGLSTAALQALTQAAAKHGVEAEQTIKSVEKFTAAFAELRNGGGALLVSIRAIDPALAELMQRTKDPATAFELLTQAINKATAAGDIFKRNELAKAAGGRGGIAGLVGVSAAVGDAGGFGNLTKSAEDAGRVIGDHLLKEVKALKTEVDEARKRADLLFGTIGAKPLLEAELAWQNLRGQIAQTGAELEKHEATLTLWEKFNRAMVNGAGYVPSVPVPPRVFTPAEGSPTIPVQRGPDLPDLTPKNIKALLADERERIALLGTAATADEKLTLRLLELKAAVQANKTAETELAATRGMSAAQLDAYIEKLNLHNAAMGAGASTSDLVKAKLAALQKQQEQGAGLSDKELANAQRLIKAQTDGTFALQAQIDGTKVQAATFDMAAGAAETYRIIQGKVNDNLNAGRNALDGLSPEFYKLANAAGAGAQALEKVKVDSSVKFGRDTAFLTPEDVQIAQQLKGLYGNDIPAALASSEAAALRMNGAMSQVSGQISGELTTALTDAVTGTKTAGDAFKSFSLIAIRAIEEMIIKLMIVGPLMRGLESGLGGSGGLLGLLGLGGGGGGGVDPTMSANGNVFNQGRVIHPYALGGIFSDIVTRPTLFPMANGAGLMGEAGPEAIMPLRRGPDGRLGVSGGSSGSGNGGMVYAPVYNIDARGSNMTEAQFRAILEENNKSERAALPSRVAAINADPRAR